MPRPRKPARLVRVPRKPNWYIRDGSTLESTGTEDEEAAQCELTYYLSQKNSPSRNPTVAEILDARLSDLKSSGKPRASNSVFYHKQLKSTFGPFRPGEITPPMVMLHWEKRKAAPSSLREELLELRVALNFAYRAGWIDRVFHIEVPNKNPPKDVYLTREQVMTLLGKAKSLHLRLFILIAMTTGARKGAILGLTWERVDMERGFIDFNDPERRETKKRRASVPVGPEVIAALRDARQFAQTAFVIEYMGSPLESIRTAFRRAAKDAGLPWATPHVLKHSVVSWLAEDGYTVDRISDLTATHPNTVRRVYRKFNPNYMRDMAESLSADLGLSNQFAKPPAKATPQKDQSPQVSLGAMMVGTAGFEPATPTMST
jgi:integrase